MTSSHDPLRGRGTGRNPHNRYQKTHRSPFDDGWTQDPPIPLKTQVGVDASRTAISFNDSPDIPFDRSINPYRGCEHGCIYCYARPTHAWLDLSPGLDFESRLFARPELPRRLREELSAPGYRPAPVALGAVTDAYQPIEREHRITRGVLELLLETRHPTILTTKSAMVERDIDLLQEMAAEQLIEVAISLTTLQKDLARAMEPRAAAPQRRLQTIARLSAAGIPVRAAIAPLIPVLNEGEIEALLQAAAEHGAVNADYVFLRLPLEVAALFRDWLQDHFPQAASRVMSHVKNSRGGRDYDGQFGRRMRGEGAYAELIRQRFDLAVRRLRLGRRSTLRCDLFRAPLQQQGQLSLF